MDKRTFLKKFSLAAMTTLPAIKAIAASVDQYEHILPSELAEDDSFWEKIREGYRIKPDYINLENGYYCLMPESTLEHYLDHVREVNYHASYYMRKVKAENYKILRERLANMAGCNFDEIVVTRNTTESLDLIISGIHWKEGDHAVMAEQDYGAMLNQFRLMEERYGITTSKVNLPNHPKNDEEIVDLYESFITDKTKLLMVSHVVNINGQVLPVKKICQMAHKYGVEVMVDGAHAFAHLNFKIPDLECDYYGTSLHKWLSAPLGAGLLYVKKDKIKNLWPLFAERELEEDDIERINHTGTKPEHIDLGIMNAIEYHEAIGRERKEARLKFLKNYWTSKLKDHPKISINTPWENERSCAIANVLVEGWKSKRLSDTLLDQYKIHTVPIYRPNVHGIRVTPNIFTSTNELDQLVEALTQMAEQGPE